MIGHQPPVRCSHSLVRSLSLSLSCCQREISTSNKGLHKNDISSDNFNNKVISITIYKSYHWSFHIKNLRQVSINLRLWGSLGAPEWQAGREGWPATPWHSSCSILSSQLSSNTYTLHVINECPLDNNYNVRNSLLDKALFKLQHWVTCKGWGGWYCENYTLCTSKQNDLLAVTLIEARHPASQESRPAAAAATTATTTLATYSSAETYTWPRLQYIQGEEATHWFTFTPFLQTWCRVWW